MGIFLVILGSIMIIAGAGLIWRASLILQRFLRQEKMEVQVAGMVDELEAVTRSCLEKIEAERKRAEDLSVALSQQLEAKSQTAAGSKQPVLEGSLPSNERYEAVWRLTEAGTDTTDIARRLGMGRGEVELIQGLKNYCSRDTLSTDDKS